MVCGLHERSDCINKLGSETGGEDPYIFDCILPVRSYVAKYTSEAIISTSACGHTILRNCKMPMSLSENGNPRWMNPFKAGRQGVRNAPTGI